MTRIFLLVYDRFILMSLTGKNILILGFIIVLLIAIPVTVYILQQKQQTETQAVASTTLCFTKTTDNICLTNTNKPSLKVGDTITLDVLMKPGTNNVIAATLNIGFDQTKIATDGSGLVRSRDAFPSLIEGPIYTDGNISITMSVGIDLTMVVKTDIKIASVTFKALKSTDTLGTQVNFTNQTNVTSTVSDPETNVLSTSTPAFLLITAGTTPTITTAPTVTAAPTTTPGPTVQNTPPICSSLNIDRVASGSAPFSVTFTAVGNDSDGTIKKATFNFGDGPVEDETVGGGIGTNSVSVQKSHTYTNSGTFTARAVLTDDKNAISSSDNCTQVITVEPSPTQPIGGPAEMTPTVPPTATPTIAQPGPGETMVGIGIGAVVLTILGGLLFLAL